MNDTFIYAFSPENPHFLRNVLLVAATIAYIVTIVILFSRLRRANQKMAEHMRQLQAEKQAEIDRRRAEQKADEEPLTHKLNTARPHKQETHTDPKS